MFEKVCLICAMSELVLFQLCGIVIVGAMAVGTAVGIDQRHRLLCGVGGTCEGVAQLKLSNPKLFGRHEVFWMQALDV